MSVLFLSGVPAQALNHASCRAVCPGAVAHTARCHAQVVTDARGNLLATTSPTGYGPFEFQTAYGLTTAAAATTTQTIAIVDAYDDPTAESDLAVYSSTHGLSACTTANGCFKKVDQTGGTRYPRGDRGWALEISLDLQTAHAICPNCRILLVEAKTNGFANLMAAVDYAATDSSVVSNSWGASEFSSETAYDSHFNRQACRSRSRPATPDTASNTPPPHGTSRRSAARRSR